METEAAEAPVQPAPLEEESPRAGEPGTHRSAGLSLSEPGTQRSAGFSLAGPGVKSAAGERVQRADLAGPEAAMRPAETAASAPPEGVDGPYGMRARRVPEAEERLFGGDSTRGPGP